MAPTIYRQQKQVGTTAGTVAAGDDTRLTNTRTPTDASVTPAKFAASAIDAAAGVASARTLGTGAAQAAAGNAAPNAHAASHLTGSDLLVGAVKGLPQWVVQATLTVSSVTQQNITDLVVPLAATGTYWFECYLIVTATSVTPDLKVKMTLPTSGTAKWGSMHSGGTTQGSWGSGATTGTIIALLDETGAHQSGGLSGRWGDSFAGRVVTAGTAGNLQITAAQNTSDATTVTIEAGSHMRVWRLS
jgi:hypothetical protein